MKTLLSDRILLRRGHLISRHSASISTGVIAVLKSRHPIKKTREHTAQIDTTSAARTEIKSPRHLTTSVGLIEISRVAGQVSHSHVGGTLDL